MKIKVKFKKGMGSNSTKEPAHERTIWQSLVANSDRIKLIVTAPLLPIALILGLLLGESQAPWFIIPLFILAFLVIGFLNFLKLLSKTIDDHNQPNS